MYHVRSVHPGGLAANSKRIRPGDILVSLNDQPVEGRTLVEIHNIIQVLIAERFHESHCHVSYSFRTECNRIIPQVGFAEYPW
jgi:hypothetical protein